VAFDVALIACPVMQFYCGTPMYLLSGVDSARSFLAVALLNTTVEFTDMRAISLGSVLDCSGMASERSGCF